MDWTRTALSHFVLLPTSYPYPLLSGTVLSLQPCLRFLFLAFSSQSKSNITSMPWIKCRYCTRTVESRTLMRHYAQTGCLKKATTASTTVPNHRHPRSRQQVSPSRSFFQPATPVSHPSASLPPIQMEDPIPIAPTESAPISRPDHSSRYPRVWVEEVPDEGDFPIFTRVTDVHPTAGRPLPGTFKTQWEQQKVQDTKDGVPPWSVFGTMEDWTFARFLMKSGMSQEKIDELPHLEAVSHYLISTL